MKRATQNLLKLLPLIDVDDEKRVDNSLVQIWKVNFGRKVKFCRNGDVLLRF